MSRSSRPRREKAVAVEDNGQAGVEERIVLEQRGYELIAEAVVAENVGRGCEPHECTVGLVGVLDVVFLHQGAHAENGAFPFAVAVCDDFELGAEGVDGFEAYAVQSDRFLERRRVVLAAGIHLRGYINERTEGNSTAIVAHGSRFFVDVHGDLLSEPHHIFVDRVVENLFQEHVYAVVGIGAVAEFSDIHAGTPLDMFFPVKGLDVLLAVIGGCRGLEIQAIFFWVKGCIFVVVHHGSVIFEQRYEKTARFAR